MNQVLALHPIAPSSRVCAGTMRLIAGSVRSSLITVISTPSATERSPQTIGKAERFIQTALREGAYATAFQHLQQRRQALLPWLRR